MLILYSQFMNWKAEGNINIRKFPSNLYLGQVTLYEVSFDLKCDVGCVLHPGSKTACMQISGARDHEQERAVAFMSCLWTSYDVIGCHHRTSYDVRLATVGNRMLAFGLIQRVSS